MHAHPRLCFTQHVKMYSYHSLLIELEGIQYLDLGVPLVLLDVHLVGGNRGHKLGRGWVGPGKGRRGDLAAPRESRGGRVHDFLKI